MATELKFERTHKGVNRGSGDRVYQAYLVELPPVGERPSRDADACLVRWNLRLPGQAVWNWYSVTICHLRDIDPEMTESRKQDPDATHELCCFANNPEHGEELMLAGAAAPLTPLNYVGQLQCSSDEIAIALCEHMVELCVDGLLMAEPSGIRGAKDMWTDRMQKFITGAEAARN